MKKYLLILCALLLTTIGASAEDHSVGDIVYHQDKAYQITGTNIVTNGSFEDESMEGWIGGSYTNSTAVTGYTRNESGGYDDGAYVQFQSGGSTETSTPHQAIAVTSGTTYYFEGYTKGAVTSGNYQYNGLFWLDESEKEDGTAFIELDWHSASSTWTKTTGIFTPSDGHPYVGLRFGWSNGTGALYDGFQIYTVEETDVDLTDTDSEHSVGDFVSVEGKHYNVKSDNKIENHSFELGYTGWTNSNDYTTTITSDKFNLETDDPQDGMRYLVGTANSGSSSDGSLGTAWAIETDKTYYFSYYVKNLDGESNTEYLKTSLTNELGTETKELPEPESVSADWQHVEYIFDNDSYAYVQVKFRWLSHHWGFDNFQLYEVEEAEEVPDDDCDYEEGDEIEMSNFKGKVVGTNLFVNGGFNNGVDGWTAGNTYTDPLDGSAVTFTETGGYNDGQYITLKSSVGAANEATPTQAISVEPGKSYLFVGYTKGTAPTSGNLRYSALFAMEDATTEANHYEDVNEASYSNDLVTLQWGDGDEYLNGWTKTMGVFSVPAEGDEYSFSYVGMRMNWSLGSYDGLQLYELDGAFTFPDDADYTIDDVATVDGVTYTVKSDNLVENGSFNERTNGWTYGSTHAGALNPYNVNYSTDGGYNDGPYITSKGGHGETNSNVVSQEVDVKTGKTYLFVGYTNGTAPSDSNKAYNGLFKMTSETAESGNAIVQMLWGNPDDELNGWTKTEGVFTAETDYVGVRFSWCGSASFDGIQIYEVEAVPETIEWEVTDAGWGTLILPFAVEDEEVISGLTLYAGNALSLDSDGTTITVSDASETIAANTPYLVSGTEGTYTFTGVATNTEDSYTSGMLTGTLVNMTQDDFTADGTEYVLQDHGTEDDGLAFYPIISGQSTGVTLDAYHCYLTTDGTEVTAFHLPGMSTGIMAVESDLIANDAIYDLSGRRVAKAVKGVYIMNGKKVLVK